MAKLAREVGALVIGVVTKPFSFEGRKKMEAAEAGLEKLLENVDGLIVISNQHLLNVIDKDMTMKSAFMRADNILLQAVRSISDFIRSISDFINDQAKINLDFNDVKTIMGNAGMVLMGTGVASGENRAVEAAELAMISPLQENLSIQGARGLIINFTGPPEMSLHEMDEAANIVLAETHEEAEIIMGLKINESSLDNSLQITVIAVGGRYCRNAKS